jgi:poly(A) polymerase
MTKNILRRLRFPRVDIEAAAQVVCHHMQFKDAKKMRKATLRRMLLRPNFDLELEQHRLDCLGSHGKLDIYDFLCEQKLLLEEKPVLLAPLVDGKDLLDLGIESGPLMGKLLNEIMDKQLSEEFSTREEALTWVKEKTAL